MLRRRPTPLARQPTEEEFNEHHANCLQSGNIANRLNEDFRFYIDLFHYGEFTEKHVHHNSSHAARLLSDLFPEGNALSVPDFNGYAPRRGFYTPDEEDADAEDSEQVGPFCCHERKGFSHHLCAEGRRRQGCASLLIRTMP
eukprot:481579-Prymnesium_polylepis.1